MDNLSLTPHTYGTQVQTKTAGNYLYIGVAWSGVLTSAPFWQMSRVTLSPDIAVMNASGDALFSHKFDDYATLVYS